MVETEAQGDAPSDVVGLRGSFAEKAREFFVVFAAERGEGRHESVIHRLVAAVDWVIFRELGARMQNQQSVHGREQKAGAALLGWCSQEELE